MNELERAVIAAAEHPGEAPPRIYEVGPQADVRFSDGTGHPFDALTATHWAQD